MRWSWWDCFVLLLPEIVRDAIEYSVMETVIMDSTNKKRKVDGDCSALEEDTVDAAMVPSLTDPHVLGLVVQSQFLPLKDQGRLLMCTTKKMPSIIAQSPVIDNSLVVASVEQGRLADDIETRGERLIWQVLFERLWHTKSRVLTLLESLGVSGLKALFRKLSGEPSRRPRSRYEPSDYTLILDVRDHDGTIILLKTISWDEVEFDPFHLFDAPVSTGVPFVWGDNAEVPLILRDYFHPIQDDAEPSEVPEGSNYPRVRLTNLNYTARLLMARKAEGGDRKVVELVHLEVEGAAEGYLAEYPEEEDYFRVEGMTIVPETFYEYDNPDYFANGCTRNAFTVLKEELSVQFSLELLHGVVVGHSSGATDTTTYSVNFIGFRFCSRVDAINPFDYRDSRIIIHEDDEIVIIVDGVAHRLLDAVIDENGD